MSETKVIPELTRFETALRESGVDPRGVKQAVRRVIKLVGEFESQRENRAGRRVRKPIRAAVRKTIRNLTTAARYAGDDSPTRTDARKLIRFAGCCDEFLELQNRASAFRGLHNRVVRRLNEKNLQAQARKKRIDATYCAREIKSGRYLKSVGNALRNCVGGEDFMDYYRDLRTGKSEFWVLLRGTAPVGLLTICTQSRAIEQCAGIENEFVDCGRDTLIALQRELSAIGDDSSEFANVGAFSFFAIDPGISPIIVEDGRQQFRVWGRHGVVILCDHHGNWSRFVFRQYDGFESLACESIYGNLSEGSLLELVLRFPALGTAINQFRPVSAPESPGRAGRTIGLRKSIRR